MLLTGAGQSAVEVDSSQCRARVVAERRPPQCLETTFIVANSWFSSCRAGFHHRSEARAGWPRIRRSQRQAHPGLHRVRHPGNPRAAAIVPSPDVQITAVCDPVKDGTNYVDWDKTGIRDSVREVLDNPNWGAGVKGIRAGRDMAKEIIETYYAKQRASENFKGVATYADFRELLEKEKDLDAVKIMTPDHLHATIAIAAMKKRKHVLMHKPLANRVAEVRMVVETARKTGWPRICWPGGGRYRGAGDDPRRRHRHLKEVHNWTDRPFWPQVDAAHGHAAGSRGFDWGLWLGPALDRPYHQLHARGLPRLVRFRRRQHRGHGQLQPVADLHGARPAGPVQHRGPIQLQLRGQRPGEHHQGERLRVSVREPRLLQVRRTRPLAGAQAVLVRRGNAALHARRAARGRQVDPRNRDAVRRRCGNDPERGADPGEEDAGLSGGQGPSGARARGGRRARGAPEWVAAFKGGPATAASFVNAAACSETIALAGAAIRYSRKVFRADQCAPALLWNAEAMEFTNAPEANQYLRREYRDGWTLTSEV